jgi:hypothetical protein
MQVRFKLEKETKGALRYQEVDDKGEPNRAGWGQDRHALLRACESRTSGSGIGTSLRRSICARF